MVAGGNACLKTVTGIYKQTIIIFGSLLNGYI